MYKPRVETDLSEQNPWQTKSRKTVYETPWIKVVECDCINPNNKSASYGVVEFKNIALGVLAIDDQEQIYLIGQWRYPLERYSWEIPEGGGRPGFDPVEEAKRELKEEAGLEAKIWQKYFEMDLSNSTTNEVAIVYLAQDLIQVNPEPEETEILKVKKIALKDAYELVNTGQIRDAISVAAIQRLYIDRVKSRT